jgi:hypothetical protein
MLKVCMRILNLTKHISAITSDFCSGRKPGDHPLSDDACSNSYVQCTVSEDAFVSNCPGIYIQNNAHL